MINVIGKWDDLYNKVHYLEAANLVTVNRVGESLRNYINNEIIWIIN